MSKNIKDIGKELMGKSLNSFHRKTGLTQLEKNNEMQDGILNGILSQVDDAYIEKIGQSNVIHLEGSGDGVVVLDSIEGNTMVNIMPLANWGNKSSDNGNCAYSQVRLNTLPFKPNTTYTTILLNAEGIVKSHWMHSLSTQGSVQGTIATFTTISDISMATSYLHIYFGGSDNTVTQEQINNIKVVVLEGDWTNKEINYFEGLQSSFEEHKEDDKYKIEILINNKNLFNKDTVEKDKALTWASGIPFIEVYSNTSDFIRVNKGIYSLTNPNSTIQICAYDSNKNALGFFIDDETTLIPLGNNGSVHLKKIQIKDDNIKYIRLGIRRVNSSTSVDLNKVQFEISETLTTVTPHKSNKIKLLLNSPLLKGDEIVCKEDGLYHYHKMGKGFVDSFTHIQEVRTNTCTVYADISEYKIKTSTSKLYGDIFFYHSSSDDFVHFRSDGTSPYSRLKIYTPISWGTTKSEISQKLKENPLTFVGELAEPYYEKISNEYGEPIILEGYENGTLYIDSVIVPTTTVRYTPKMESFKTLKEVKIRNTINDFDVANNVIPYMMEVDIKLTELEMSAISTYNIKNIRKMEVLDMISMQERTFKMLERLIRGKSHTKQEMIDRVLLYEQAKRITTEQALELNLVIEEVYGA